MAVSEAVTPTCGSTLLCGVEAGKHLCRRGLPFPVSRESWRGLWLGSDLQNVVDVGFMASRPGPYQPPAGPSTPLGLPGSCPCRMAALPSAQALNGTLLPLPPLPAAFHVSKTETPFALSPRDLGLICHSRSGKARARQTKVLMGSATAPGSNRSLPKSQWVGDSGVGNTWSRSCLYRLLEGCAWASRLPSLGLSFPL